MSDITLTTLKKGAELLDLDIEGLKKKKEIEAAIDKALEDRELGYECPSCGKDIPDVEACFYCGENFAEDAAGPEDEDKDGEDTEAEGLDDDTAEAVAEVVETKGTKKSNKAKDEKKAEKPEKPEKPEKEEKKEAKTTGGKQGRPAGKTKNTEEKDSEFEALIEEIDGVLKDVEKRERKTGVTYVKDGKRLLKAVKTGKTFSIEFNVELKSDDDNLKKYSEEEAKAKHLGSCRAIYSFGDSKAALKLVKEAVKTK